MRRVGIGVGLAALALVLGSPGGTAPLARQIKIAGGRPQPKELHVPVNATVEFVNRDRRAHTIKSVRNAWPVFTVPAHGRATVKLLTAGRYEYKVDARRKGVIIAGRVIVGFTPGPGTVLLHENFRYSIRVEVSIHSKQVWSDGPPSTHGTIDSTMQWVGTWPSYRMRIERVAASATFSSLGSTIGTIRFSKMDYSDSRPFTPACATKVDYPPLRAEAFLRGDATFVAFDSHTVGSGKATLDHMMDAARTSCSSADFPVWLEEPDPVTADKVRVDPPRSGIGPDDARFDRSGRGRPFPINRVFARQGFTVDTGPRAVAPRSCGNGCTESFEGRVRFVFRALPPR